ncbi:MAG: hypothetical protein IT561_10920 [Alphaproteobacteria bacterium]|nr:hypothetical protein [Alphaproteobacteria bacterium]
MRAILSAALLWLALATVAAASAQVPGGAAPPASAGPAAPATRLPPDLRFEDFVQASGPLGHKHDLTPLAIGAISGVVLFNMVAATLAPPLAAGAPLAGTVIADSALAASRIYAVGSAVLGAWVADWLYNSVYEKVGTR